MTDSLDDALLLEVLRSELGPNSTVFRADVPPGTLWDRVLGSVGDWMGRKVPLFAADSAVPEIFCLDSEASPAVVTNGGYFERLAKFRHAMFDPSLGSARAAVIEQLFLETTAIQCLKVGDPDVGALLFQKSLQKRNYLVDVPQLFDATGNHLNSSGSDVVEGFFPVVHEIGHMNRDTASLLFQLSPVSDSSLIKQMEKTLGSITWMTPEIHTYALETATQQRTSHLLGLDNVRREGYADIFAAQRLFAVAVLMTQHQQVDFDPVAFMSVLHREFNVVNVLQRTKLVARMTREYPLTAQNALVAMLYPVAMAMRSYLMTAGLLGFAKQHIPAGSPLAADGALLSEWLRVMSPEVLHTMAECDAGVDQAMSALIPELLLTTRPTLEATRQALGRSQYAQLDASTFLAKAARLKVETPLLRTFRKLVDDPDGWDGIVEGEGRTYFVLMAAAQDRESPRYFSIPLEGRARAVCAFTSQDTMEIFTSDFISGYLAPDERFVAAALKVQHVALLEELIRAEIGEPITLIVQGSSAFEDLIRAIEVKKLGVVADASAKADVRKRAQEAMFDRYKLYATQTQDPATFEQFTHIVRLLEDL